MSNSERIENLKLVVAQARPDFERLVAVHGAVNWEREFSFANQILQANQYLMSVALGDQASVVRAVLDVAASGLTLNPSQKLVYLVPRGKKVCLDIGYLGMIHRAVESKAIKYAETKLVYEKDTYVPGGNGNAPVHRYDAFSDRGKIIGVYCVAELYSDRFLATEMSLADVYKIRDKYSEAWKSGSGPWKTEPEEMIKKTCVRRAFKTWPKGDTRDDRMRKVIDLVEEAEPTVETEAVPPADDSYQLLMGRIRSALVTLDKTEEYYLTYLTRTTKREIKRLEDLTKIEADQAIIFLDQQVEKRRKLAEDSFENVV